MMPQPDQMPKFNLNKGKVTSSMISRQDSTTALTSSLPIAAAATHNSSSLKQAGPSPRKRQSKMTSSTRKRSTRKSQQMTSTSTSELLSLLPKNKLQVRAKWLTLMICLATTALLVPPSLKLTKEPTLWTSLMTLTSTTTTQLLSKLLPLTTSSVQVSRYLPKITLFYNLNLLMIFLEFSPKLFLSLSHRKNNNLRSLNLSLILEDFIPLKLIPNNKQ